MPGLLCVVRVLLQQNFASCSNPLSIAKQEGKQLFMPLRQAITGMDHGPELANMLVLIGPEKVQERLSQKKAA